MWWAWPRWAGPSPCRPSGLSLTFTWARWHGGCGWWEWMPPMANDASDDALIEQANAERRILLTQDRGLLRRRALWLGGYVYV